MISVTSVRELSHVETVITPLMPVSGARSSRRWAGKAERRMLRESLCWDHLLEDADCKRDLLEWDKGQVSCSLVGKIRNILSNCLAF